MFFYPGTCTSQTRCCQIYKCASIQKSDKNHRWKYKRKKAGVFLYCPSSRRILLVQSHGRKWGAPKGTVEDIDYDLKTCALRELEEETGITLEPNQLEQSISINRTTYFIVPFKLDFSIDQIASDITGIGWVRIECLEQFDINSHTKQLVQKMNL